MRYSAGLRGSAALPLAEWLRLSRPSSEILKIHFMRHVPKSAYYALTTLNSLGTSFYYFYLFFFMERQFGFGNLGNLTMSAAHGFLYMFAARHGGRYGQLHGYHRALRIGVVVMLGAMVIAWQSSTVAAHLGALAIWTCGVCFTWPTLEALVSEGETPAGLHRSLGVYNLVWAGSSACAYFFGSTILDVFGAKSLFLVPAGIHAAQWVILTLAERGYWNVLSGRLQAAPPAAPPPELNPRPIARAKLFLKMAWMANPFAYVAINTVAAIMPVLAGGFGLSPKLVGVFCSVWFFARLATFLVLWLWPGWHYSLSWFLGACGLLVASFVGISLGRVLWIVIPSQIAFGIAIGLLYSSSLYYSMDAGDSKGEHGGIHESAIGAGIFLGPAVGVAGITLFPSQPHSVTWSVGILLAIGMSAMCWVAARFVRTQK